MNSYELPLFFDIDCGSDDTWSIKDMANIDSSTDFDAECMAFSDLTGDCRKNTRITSEAMNIPQIGFLSARSKEFFESPNFLDPDTNFYDHIADSKCVNFPSIDAETSSPLSLWGTPVEMDQPRFDEIFQVEESKAIQGPTLAQLNSNSEPSFDIISFNDIYTEEMRPSLNDSFLTKRRKRTLLVNDLVTSVSERKVPVTNTGEIFSEDFHLEKREETGAVYLQGNVSNCISNIATTSTTQVNAFTNIPMTNVGITKLQQLLNGNIPTANLMSDSPMLNTSTTAPTENTTELCAGLQLPEEPSIRQRNNSSTDRSLCSFSSLSLSNDEGFDSSQDGFGLDEDESSDADFGDADKYNFTTYFPISSSKHKSSDTKRKRYFWQYNIQSKGPKGPKMPLETSRLADPHFLGVASDPVFSSHCTVSGVKHTGKVRRGDGNDLTPNPHKLYSIGLELKKLSKIINDLEPTVEQPFNTRPKSRREKNKLASRVCRLKKKAQHEANKLKFYGLQKEHDNLCALLEEIKQLTAEKIEGRAKRFSSEDIEKLIASHGVPKVAENTAEFVNHILGRVAGGDPAGGVYEL